MGICMSCGEGSWESEKMLLGGGGGKKTGTSTSAAFAAAVKVVSMKGNLHEYKVPIVVSQVLQAEYSISSSSSSICSAININDDDDDDDDRKGYFICNSDLLLYDEYIPAMYSNAHLLPNVLYFVLPTSKLNYRLSASDMAALAVKATLALQSSTQLITTTNNYIIMTKNKKKKEKKKINQISPIMIMSLSDTNARPSNHHHHHNDVVIGQDDIDYAIHHHHHHHAIYNMKRLDANAKSHINYKPPSSSHPNDHDIRVGYSPRSTSSNIRINRSFLKYSSSSSLRRPKQLSAASNSFRLTLTTIYEGVVLF